MNVRLNEKLAGLAAADNRDVFSFNRGLEREALRVDPQGKLAATLHPPFLGSKLCNPLITTDFSEAQLELITPVSNSIPEMLSGLNDILRFVHSGLHNELLWSASMPCVLQGDDQIPLAQYGPSNLGTLKTTYRNGLGHRYGRSMQTICAVHYNFSFSDTFWRALARVEGASADSKDYRSSRYFDLMRNFRRFSWLLIYLFGASPAVCNTFVEGRDHDLEKFDEGSLYARGATSLRNGDLGYQSDTQAGLINICYNSLADYVNTLAEAICTPHEDYLKLGLVNDGEHIQISPNILQSEAEFYSTVRAKRTPPKGENFLRVLLEEGVEYVEIRLLDIDPFVPLGITEEQIRFLDTLLLYCVLEESPGHDDPLCQSVKENITTTVYGGREPGTTLNDGGNPRPVRQWGLEITSAMEPVARLLDASTGDDDAHARALASQRAKLHDAELTPSASVLQHMRGESIPFFRFAMNKAIEHQEHFLEQPLSAAEKDYFNALSEQSLQAQREIEQADAIDFSEYLGNFLQGYESLLRQL